MPGPLDLVHIESDIDQGCQDFFAVKAGEKVSRDQIESMEAKMVAMGAF